MYITKSHYKYIYILIYKMVDNNTKEDRLPVIVPYTRILTQLTIAFYRVFTGILYLWQYYTQITIVGHILLLIVNIILVHLIFEMPPRKKNQTFSHQQNIWISTNYGEFISPTALRKEFRKHFNLSPRQLPHSYAFSRVINRFMASCDVFSSKLRSSANLNYGRKY